MSADLCCGQLQTVMVLVMQTDAPFWDSLVFEGIDDVDVEAVTAAFGTVEVAARGRAAGAACPDCGRFSDRVHHRYQRRLKDLPLAEQGLVIRLTVRRFIGGSADCQRRTFAEPFSRLAARTHGSPRGSTTPWSEWGSRWPGEPAPGWRPSWASARDG
ncbi:transposase family protein [Streptomyces paradoxus]|uniref:transposase family protein n=1 Tax=Streptomyces paradoxus TaxID=66375 RepID=UPI003818DED3